MSNANRQQDKCPAWRSSNSATTSRQNPISGALLQPWFLDRETAVAVQRLIPRKYFFRMRWYFEDFGCLACGRKNRVYHSNGFCLQCFSLVSQRMVACMKRRKRLLKNHENSISRHNYLARAEEAQKLLGDLAAKGF